MLRIRSAICFVRRSYSASSRLEDVAPFRYQELFDLSPDTKTEYKKLQNSEKLVSELDVGGMKFLKVEPDALTEISKQSMKGVQFPSSITKILTHIYFIIWLSTRYCALTSACPLAAT